MPDGIFSWYRPWCLPAVALPGHATRPGRKDPSSYGLKAPSTLEVLLRAALLMPVEITLKKRDTKPQLLD